MIKITNSTLNCASLCAWALMFILPYSAIAQKPLSTHFAAEAIQSNNFQQYCKGNWADLRTNADLSTTAEAKEIAEQAIEQFGRWEYQWKNYIGKDGRFPTRMADWDVLHLQPNTAISPISVGDRGNSGQWTQVGPKKNVNQHGYIEYPGMGRVNVVRTLGTGIFLVGTPNGGIWKTTDNGAHWSPKTDRLARLGITDIRINPNNNNQVFAITGDRDGSVTASIGVIRSNDAGETWQTTGLVVSPEIDADFATCPLGISPTDPAKLVTSINSKIYYSSNGGVSFNNSAAVIEMANDLIYGDGFLLISTIKGQIFRSTDDGQTFVKIFDDMLGAQESFCLRFNQKVIGNQVYFFAALPQDGRVYKVSKADILAANESNLLDLTALGGSISDYSPQGIYDVAFAVNPMDASKIFAAGVDGYFSTNSGETWTKVLDAYGSANSGQLYVHPDHHFADFLDDHTILEGNDGGVFLLNSSNIPFTQNDITSDLIISQIYHTAIFPSDQNNENFIMGLQDNDGFSKSPNTLNGEWVAVSAGDGSAAGINQNDPLIRFIGGTEGALYRTTTAFQANYDDKMNVIESNSDAPFICEVTIHNQNPDYVFAGHTEMKYSTDGGINFEEVSSDLFVGGTAEIEQYGNRIVVIGAVGQKIAKFENGTFSDIQYLEKPANGSLFNSISLSTPDNMVVYATTAGYDAGEKVYKSSDNGQTWTNISFDLPNVIAKKIMNKVTNLGGADEVLFLATNVGVYVKIGSTSTNWVVLGDNLPFTEINDLDINYVVNKLYASTYGRGIWEYPIGDLMVATQNPSKETFNFQISPNPIASGGELNLDLSGDISATQFSIYNYIGGKMFEFNANSGKNKVMLPNLSAGMYLVVSEKTGKQSTQQLIITK